LSSLAELLAQLNGRNEDQAEVASAELARLGQAALPALLVLLKSSDVDQRWWAVRTLARLATPQPTALLEALTDPVPEIREAAALALAVHPTDEPIPALVRALEDEDNMVPGLAAKALAAIGRSAVPSLIEAFESASPRGRIHMMRALAELCDHRAIPLMMRAMDEDSALLNYWAREGLERLGLNMVYIKPG
jgi:HEAT repeat protein